MDRRRNYDWYDERAQDVNLVDMTSSEKNSDILRKLRDGDDDFIQLSIVRTDYGDDDDFVVEGGDDGDAMGWLGFFIDRSKRLEELTIYPCPEGRREQIDAMYREMSHNQSIRKLCIHNEFGFGSSQNLAPFFRNSHSLTRLRITQTFNPVSGFNVVGDGSAIAFALSQCRHGSLKNLEIEGISNVRGMVEIATALRDHSQIEELTLIGNRIGRSGCAALGNTLQSWGASNLESLYMFSSDIDDECLHSLSGGLANCHRLIRLGLVGNESITAAGLRLLSTVFQSESCSLEDLDLRGINIEDEGVEALTDALVGNTSLKRLLIDGLDISVTAGVLDDKRNNSRHYHSSNNKTISTMTDVVSTMTDVEITNKKDELTDTHDVALTPFTIFRYTYSVLLLAFSIVLVIALMFTGNTKLAADASPWAALIVCVAAVVWLSMIEGQQASLVGLPPIDPNLYKDTHPVTYLNVACAFLGDNLDRYLMGRQFMVLLVVFVINLCGAPTSADADVLGMPQWLKTIFLDIGLGMIIFTCQLGQLTTQVNASHCMLDFINNYFALFTLYFAMCVEFSGAMHSSYLIRNILSLASGRPIHSNEEPKKGFTFVFFWGRVLMSLAILGFSLAVVMSALFQGRTMMAVKYPSVSEGASVFLFFLLMCIVGMLEGMQIAFFAVAKLPESELGTSLFGRKTCELLFKGNGQNLPGFMIGRQLTVAASFFIIASVTSINIKPGNADGNIFGVSDGAQAFLNLGFHAAVITTILASITWQLAAAAFPIAFLNNPATYILLCFALFLDWIGLCAGAWVLARIMKKALKYEYDEVYVGTPEERTTKNHADKDFSDDVGHMYGGGFCGHHVSHDALDGPVQSKDAIDEAA